jgi:hypothetical protein
MTITTTYQTASYGVPETTINSIAIGSQHSPDVLALDNGGFVAAYRTEGGTLALDFFNDGGGHIAQRLPHAGATLPYGVPSLTQLSNGNVLIVWAESDPGSPGLKGRLFTPAGVALGAELTLVANDDAAAPKIAALRNGGFALTYALDGAEAFEVVFTNSGALVEGFAEVANLPGYVTDPSITALADGGYVVSATEYMAATGYQVIGRVYNADGTPRSIPLELGSDADMLDSEVVALPNGNWAVVHTESGALESGISLQLRAPNGAKLGETIQVSAASAADAFSAAATVLANGLVLVTWSTSDSLAVYGRLLDQNGTLLSGVLPVASDGVSVALATLASQQVLAAWQGSAGDGSGSRIASSRFEIIRFTTGDGADDLIMGDALDDRMDGGPGNDRFSAAGGQNGIEGGAGDDTAVYALPFSSYDVTDHGGSIELKGAGGTDFLAGVEHLQFGDGIVDVNDGDPLFDAIHYMHQNADVFHAGVNALEHYETFGWREGRDPNGWFDTSGYLANNPDVAAAGVNPLEHYHHTGWKEGRDPSAHFDTRLYLLHNPDVAAAGVDPLEHYLALGRSEGRQAHAAVGPIVSCFDAQYYLFHNPDVAAAGLDALTHFNAIGGYEGRDPNAWFDTAGYLAHYADVAAAGVNPLEHYTAYGWKEGRDPSAAFDTLDYLAANPDVAAAGVDPLEHFLTSGVYEGRQAVNDGLWH